MDTGTCGAFFNKHGPACVDAQISKPSKSQNIMFICTGIGAVDQRLSYQEAHGEGFRSATLNLLLIISWTSDLLMGRTLWCQLQWVPSSVSDFSNDISCKQFSSNATLHYYTIETSWWIIINQTRIVATLNNGIGTPRKCSGHHIMLHTGECACLEKGWQQTPIWKAVCLFNSKQEHVKEIGQASDAIGGNP